MLNSVSLQYPYCVDRFIDLLIVFKDNIVSKVKSGRNQRKKPVLTEKEKKQRKRLKGGKSR